MAFPPPVLFFLIRILDKIMNKTRLTKPALLLGLFMISLPAFSNGGPLDPPPGGPAPSMRTLDDIGEAADAGVDTRVIIDAVPVVIDEPGSYVLTQNLEVSETDVTAITIESSHVSLDLNGFTLSGPGSGTGRGVAVAQLTNNVAVKNGTIRNWGYQAIFSRNSPNGTFTDLFLSDNGSDGILVGPGSLIHRVRAVGNSGHGVFLMEGNGCVVSHVIAQENTLSGIHVKRSIVKNCLATGNGAHGIHNPTGTIKNSVANGNGEYGVSMEGTIGVIAFSSATENTLGDMNASSATITGSSSDN